MKLAVVSHKQCWLSQDSRSGYATDGGFPYQMAALAELFEETALLVPCIREHKQSGLSPLTGDNLSVVALTMPLGTLAWRKIMLLVWFLRNSIRLIKALHSADVVHVLLPGDVGMIGALLAMLMGKRTFIRYCGHWSAPRTNAERLQQWFMRRFASDKRIMLATGGGDKLPSSDTTKIHWVFATTLREEELKHISRIHHLVPEKKKTLILVARQEQIKGTDKVIKSLPAIRNLYPNTRFSVIGEGGALDEFKRCAADLGLSDCVDFYGRLSHSAVIAQLQEADLFCYPTTTEGFPKAVVEALACGLPVVATRVSVLPYLIGQGCGFLLSGCTSEDISQAVIEVFSDEERYRMMSEKALETAKDFSLERWQDTIKKILETSWGSLKGNY